VIISGPMHKRASLFLERIQIWLVGPTSGLDAAAQIENVLVLSGIKPGYQLSRLYLYSVYELKFLH
jgi:hypothetical protein